MMGMDQPVTREQIEEEIRGEPIIRDGRLPSVSMGFTVEPGPNGILVTTNRNGNIVPLEEGDILIGTATGNSNIYLDGSLTLQSVNLVANPVDYHTRLNL